MKRSNDMKTQLKPIAAAVALALAAGPGAASEFWLCAKETTLTLPDGTPVPMWGYAEDDNNDLTDGCGTGVAQIPGPTLELTDGNLTIHLRNDLPEGNPTSIVIPGQALPAGSTPTFVGGRVRSFGSEVAPGATGAYDFGTLSGNGTLLYHSGTHPQKQVYMGLGGLVTNDAVPGSQVHPGVPYANAVELFYTDIDPAFNAAVAGGTLTSAIDRHPTWFLINGAPYAANVTADIDTGSSGPMAASSPTLLRLASLTTDTHVAVLQGLQMTIHAEDGIQYNWQDVATGASTPAPRVQYSAMLPPAKTKDAIVVAPAEGRFTVYDGNGYMTNPSNPANEAVGDTVGGMLRFLAFGPPAPVNLLPVAANDAYSTDQDTALTVVVAGGVLANDSDPDNGPSALSAVLGTDARNGTLALNPDGSFTYTPNPAFFGNDSFTYTASDGADSSAQATVAITVNEVVTPTVTLYFSTSGNTNPPGVGGTADNADIYSWNGTSFARVLDVTTTGVPGGANMDGMTVEGGTYYASFTSDITIAGVAYQDEDIVAYNGTTWSLYFDGTALGLTAGGEDIDGFDILGGVLYFSTSGNTNPPGVGGTADNADVYSWNGTSFARVLDVTTVGVPSGANVDGLRVQGAVYYLSFADNVTIAGVAYQDEDIVAYDSSNGTWSLYFDGTGAGLTAGGQDIDAFDVTP